MMWLSSWGSLQLTKIFFVMVCWVNSAPVMSVPYTTALEAIGYFLNSAFTDADNMVAISTWKYIVDGHKYFSGVLCSNYLWQLWSGTAGKVNGDP